MAGVLSKGITFSVAAKSNATVTETLVTAYLATNGSTAIPNLQEIGDLNAGKGGAGFDKVEVTTLADSKHKYIDGLLADEENSSIDFKFLFDATAYKFLYDVKEAIYDDASEGLNFIITLPNGEKFTIVGGFAIKLDGVGVNSALTMTLTVTPTESITFVKGA